MSRKISIILLALLSVVLGLWIWSVAAPKNSIILGGSTSVNPFMQKLTKKYYHESEKDFIYNSTGSQAGVGGVEKGMYSAGFISKKISDTTLSKGNTFSNVCANPKEEECRFENVDLNHWKNENNDISKNNSYIALEFAIDAIGVIFNSPSYWNEVITYDEDQKTISLNDLMNFDLNNNKELLAKIYSGNMYWEELAKEVLKGYENSTFYSQLNAKIPTSNKTKIVTFTREDGSGTRSAFSDLTGIKDMHSSNVVNSNGSMIENMSNVPSIGYVSNGFLGQLTDQGAIKLAGIDGKKLAINKSNKPKEWNKTDHKWENWKINGEDGNSEDFIKKAYTFKRPFIAIFNIYNKNLEQLIQLFEWMHNADEAKSVFEDEGLVRDMNYQSPSPKKVLGGNYA
ncbi:phosphate ABC transporter substrate-binding protein [Spiroplasma floricola]|uniref:Phosphate ABC transporter substrate-binding protein n=1 Tax=Spiroplasma floricola 23-6 TaxID=1336749 RepID=A0A2K8SEP4_9MOLU|nr:phosphate ABC transporter substrate-binding protein [Spiroplasma floricola]AUB31937.1 phosphate ABC transporter substrate-binding protein [Spiroplasma floricola 23-6]